MTQWRYRQRYRRPAELIFIQLAYERAQQENDPKVKSYLMQNVRDLCAIDGVGADAEDCIRELADAVCTAFLVKSCPRCHESKMALIEISPNAKSIEYACAYCHRRQRAVANSPDAERAKSLEIIVIAVFGQTWFKTVRDGYRCTFSVPEAALPYQRPTRERVPQAMISEVWRRDRGRCVRCESGKDLHVDHIVPLSKGGGTIVRNLQLLCESCNLSKGDRI